MSTDYGFGCVTCGRRSDGSGFLNQQVIMENCREPDVLARWLDALSNETLRAVLNNAELAFYRDGWYGVSDALLFILAHRSDGHDVRVVNEYGTWFGSCYKRVPCPHCTALMPCRLDLGHQGDCVALDRSVEHEPPASPEDGGT